MGSKLDEKTAKKDQYADKNYMAYIINEDVINKNGLTPEERLLRRKFKNRVSAQNARDRKKAQFANMADQIKSLEDEVVSLKCQKKSMEVILSAVFKLYRELQKNDHSITPDVMNKINELNLDDSLKAERAARALIKLNLHLTEDGFSIVSLIKLANLFPSMEESLKISQSEFTEFSDSIPSDIIDNNINGTRQINNSKNVDSGFNGDNILPLNVPRTVIKNINHNMNSVFSNIYTGQLENLNMQNSLTNKMIPQTKINQKSDIYPSNQMNLSAYDKNEISNNTITYNNGYRSNLGMGFENSEHLSHENNQFNNHTTNISNNDNISDHIHLPDSKNLYEFNAIAPNAIDANVYQNSWPANSVNGASSNDLLFLYSNASQGTSPIVSKYSDNNSTNNELSTNFDNIIDDITNRMLPATEFCDDINTLSHQFRENNNGGIISNHTETRSSNDNDFYLKNFLNMNNYLPSLNNQLNDPNHGKMEISSGSSNPSSDLDRFITQTQLNMNVFGNDLSSHMSHNEIYLDKQIEKNMGQKSENIKTKSSNNLDRDVINPNLENTFSKNSFGNTEITIENMILPDQKLFIGMENDVFDDRMRKNYDSSSLKSFSCKNTEKPVQNSLNEFKSHIGKEIENKITNETMNKYHPTSKKANFEIQSKDRSDKSKNYVMHDQIHLQAINDGINEHQGCLFGNLSSSNDINKFLNEDPEFHGEIPNSQIDIFQFQQDRIFKKPNKISIDIPLITISDEQESVSYKENTKLHGENANFLEYIDSDIQNDGKNRHITDSNNYKSDNILSIADGNLNNSLSNFEYSSNSNNSTANMNNEEYYYRFENSNTPKKRKKEICQLTPNKNLNEIKFGNENSKAKTSSVNLTRDSFLSNRGDKLFVSIKASSPPVLAKNLAKSAGILEKWNKFVPKDHENSEIDQSSLEKSQKRNINRLNKILNQKKASKDSSELVPDSLIDSFLNTAPSSRIRDSVEKIISYINDNFSPTKNVKNNRKMKSKIQSSELNSSSIFEFKNSLKNASVNQLNCLMHSLHTINGVKSVGKKNVESIKKISITVQNELDRKERDISSKKRFQIVRPNDCINKKLINANQQCNVEDNSTSSSEDISFLSNIIVSEISENSASNGNSVINVNHPIVKTLPDNHSSDINTKMKKSFEDDNYWYKDILIHNDMNPPVNKNIHSQPSEIDQNTFDQLLDFVHKILKNDNANNSTVSEPENMMNAVMIPDSNDKTSGLNNSSNYEVQMKLTTTKTNKNSTDNQTYASFNYIEHDISSLLDANDSIIFEDFSKLTDSDNESKYSSIENDILGPNTAMINFDHSINRKNGVWTIEDDSKFDCHESMEVSTLQIYDGHNSTNCSLNSTNSIESSNDENIQVSNEKLMSSMFISDMDNVKQVSRIDIYSKNIPMSVLSMNDVEKSVHNSSLVKNERVNNSINDKFTECGQEAKTQSNMHLVNVAENLNVDRSGYNDLEMIKAVSLMWIRFSPIVCHLSKNFHFISLYLCLFVLMSFFTMPFSKKSLKSLFYHSKFISPSLKYLIFHIRLEIFDESSKMPYHKHANQMNIRNLKNIKTFRNIISMIAFLLLMNANFLSSRSTIYSTNGNSSILDDFYECSHSDIYTHDKCASTNFTSSLNWRMVETTKSAKIAVKTKDYGNLLPIDLYHNNFRLELFSSLNYPKPDAETGFLSFTRDYLMKIANINILNDINNSKIFSVLETDITHSNC